MKVIFLIKRKTITLDPCPSTLSEALGQLDVEGELVLAVRDGQMILPDDRLSEGNVIRLVPTYAGG